MKTRWLAFAVIVVFGIFGALFLTFNSHIVDAQDKTNFSELLEELNRRIIDENGFTFFVVFASSPGNSIVQAQVGGEDGFSISEIGIDYFCMNQLAGAALTKSCFPYSNIASIGFLET